ncbi:hypothetical protein [Pseudomonas phage PotUPM1]|nr:hypothetical protein [Pseudomonas phage PotUPM1]
MRRGMRNLARSHRRHPDGYSTTLRMSFPELAERGWRKVNDHRVQLADGWAIEAQLGDQDGFRVWRYRLINPAGTVLCWLPSAVGAAAWAEREQRRAPDAR